jgi:hypothetical protein
MYRVGTGAPIRPPGRPGRSGPPGRPGRVGPGGLLATAVAAHPLLAAWALPALAQTSGPTSSTVAGQGSGGRMSGSFIVVAVIAGLLLFLFQRRTFRRMQDMFDPDSDRPEPPGGPDRRPGS